jgi:DNA repair protein RadC
MVDPSGEIGNTIGDLASAANLFAPLLTDLAHEEMHCAFLDRDRRLLMVRVVNRGSYGRIVMPTRAVIRDALLLGADALIIAHNHPSGDAEPSVADKIATRLLADTARPLGVKVIDHLIFAEKRVTSFRALGLL